MAHDGQNVSSSFGIIQYLVLKICTARFKISTTISNNSYVLLHEGQYCRCYISLLVYPTETLGLPTHNIRTLACDQRLEKQLNLSKPIYYSTSVLIDIVLCYQYQSGRYTQDTEVYLIQAYNVIQPRPNMKAFKCGSTET